MYGRTEVGDGEEWMNMPMGTLFGREFDFNSSLDPEAQLFDLDVTHFGMGLVSTNKLGTTNS